MPPVLHVVPCGQPLLAAVGSQSCVLLPLHAGAQTEALPPALRQQTWPIMQSAVAAHFSATPMQPPPRQLKSNAEAASPGVTQHTCAIMHELVPHARPPLDPPSFVPPSPEPPSFDPPSPALPLLLPLLDDAVPLLLPLELEPPLLDDAVPLLLPLLPLLLLLLSSLPPSPAFPPPLPEELPHAMPARPKPTNTANKLFFMTSLLPVHSVHFNR